MNKKLGAVSIKRRQVPVAPCLSLVRLSYETNMGKTSSMWALLFIVPCVLAGPILQNSCASECRSPLNSKFRYAAGQTYTYNFQAKSQTWMMGTSDDQAVLEVKGQALVSFRDSCDAVLQIRQATISGLEEKVEAIELEKWPLSFSWQDGTVDSLCPEQEDPVWVVNIKRSVLSMLQHTAQFLEVPETHVIESDVIGRCPTEYTVEGTGSSIKVTKTKIPNQCSSRIDRQSSIPTVSYNVAAEIQTIPLMNSTTVCVMQIKDNLVQTTECRESHLFRPLSSEEGGARTEVTSSVSLISTTSAGVAAKLSSNLVSRTLILDPLGVQVEFQDAKDVSVVIRSICQQLAADSPPKFVSQLFTELVHSLRKASIRDVKVAYNNLRGKKICPESTKTEKLFLDALPQAGNTAAISLMVDILKENKLSTRQALGWYLSLPLAKFADLDSVKAVLPLIESASTSPVALLGLTGLARRYCSENVEQCQTSTEVLQFSTKLSKMLGNRCRADAKDEIKIISVLKALGNLGVMTAEARTTVADCAKDIKLPITVRLAAIQATRNNPCEKQVKDNLLNILEDKNEDAEVRIAAYQGVMRCPCSHSLLRIQTLLNAEEVNQVGSYISSHLQNIRLNPTPGKENARRLVKKLSLDKSFPADLRKYSRNIAVSDFCNINNAGWDIDANIVYAPKSFIPRSASMNLTLDLFGQSINVFEIGMRAENLERLLEAYLGPDGVLDKEGVAGLLEKTSDSVSQFSENIWNRVASATRSKRANIKTNELSNLDKIVNLKDKPSGIKLDAFLRVFGSEIGMYAYRGTANSQARLDLVENAQSRIAQAFRDLIEGAKRVEIDVARSVMFLDTAATFPTVAGFPLRLAVNGTSTIGLGLESQMDLPALFKDPLNSNIKLKLNPLAVTELSASMTIDIAVAKTGIKMAATIHSSMAADFSARLQQGNTVEVKLDLPKSKITLIDFKSAVLLVQQTADKAERNKPVKIVNEATYARGGCSDRLSSVTGMRLCASSSVSIPRPLSDSSKDTAPAFPLSGFGSFAIVLEKTEPTMKGYLLSATTTQEGPQMTSFLMTLDTPGSKTNRKVSIKGFLSSAPTVTVKVDSKAPWGNLAVEAEMVNEADIKSVLVKVLTQEKREYYGKVQVGVSRENRKYSLATTVEAGWPQQPRAIILEGGFSHEVGRSVELSLKPSGPYAKLPYAFQVTVGREFSATTQKVWLNNLEMTTPFGKALLSTEISRQDKNYLATFNMKYGTEQKMNAVNFSGHIQAATQPDKSLSYKTNVLYKSSRFPAMNVDLKWDILSSPTMLSNVLILVHGPEVNHSTNRLYLNKQIQLKGFGTRDFVFENKLEVTYPRYALNLKMDQALKMDQRLVKGIMTLQMDNVKFVDGELALVIAPKDPKNLYELTAKLAYPGRTFSLVDTGRKIDSNSFSVSPVLEIQPGTKIELSGKASLIKDQNGVSANMDSEVRIRGYNSPVKVSHSFQYTGDMSSMTTSNKIEWAGQPQIVLDGKLFFRTRKMPAMELAFLWNNRLDAKLETRLSRAESKLDMDINLIRLERRVKISSQHKFLGDTTSGSLNVAWDADRDSTKQVGLDGTFTVSPSQRLIDLKSTVNIENRIYSVAFNGKLGSFDFTNGDHTARVELQLPTTKKMALAMSLFNVYQPRTISNRLEVETQTPTGNTYQISMTNAINDLDFNMYTYNANTDVTIKGTGIDDVKIRLDSKRIVRADKRNVEFKGLVIAPKWGQNIDSSLSVEVTKDSFRFGTKYQRGPMLVTVDSVGKSTTQNGKWNVDGYVEVKAPKTSWQQTKIAMVSSYDITSISNFDITEKISVEYKSSKSITLDTKMKLSPSAADFSVMLETPFEVARRQGIIVSGRFEPTNPRSEGSLVVMWSSPSQRQAQEARVEFDMERRPGQTRFKLTTATPIKSLESSELSFDIRSLEDSKIYEVDVVAGLSEDKAKLNGRINLNPAQREVDLTVTLPNFNPLRVLVRIGSQASTYTVENRVDWGTGTFTVSGTTKYVNSGNFEVEMQIHSPELGINNFELKGANKMQNNQRIMEFTVMRKSSTIASLKSVYAYKQDSTGVQISGTAQVSTPESPFSGSVKYTFENRKVESGDEKGILYKLEVDVTADEFILNKVNSHLKLTNKEKSGSLVLCTSSNQCNEGSFAFKDTGSKAIIAKELHALVKTKKNNVEEVRGMRVKLSASANKFENTAEILFDEAKNRLVGYKVYKKDSEFGLEIYTPKRITGAALEIVRGSGRQAVKSQFILTVWMDKAKAPERKLVISTTAESNKMGDMEGYSTSTIIKHPMLSRELEYKIEFHKLPSVKSGRDLFHFKLDADVMDPKHQRWTFETYVKNTLADKNGRNITVDMELRSKGTDLATLLTIFGGRTAENVLLAGANLKLKEKERIEKELFVRLDASPRLAYLTLGSPAKQMTLEARMNTEDIVSYKRLQLSASTRIFGLPPTVYVLDMNTSPHVDIRVFSKGSPENYHQVVGGLLDDTRFELALIRQLNVQRKELAAVYVTLNSSTLLTERLTWKLDDLRALRTAIRTRSEATANEVSSVRRSLTPELNTYMLKWRSFSNFKNMYDKMATDYAKQLNQLKTEVEEDESMKAVVEMMEKITLVVKKLGERIGDIAEQVGEKSDLVEAVEKVIENVIETITERITEHMKTAKKTVAQLLDELSRYFEQWKIQYGQEQGLFTAIKNFYQEKSNQISGYVAKFKLSFDDRFRNLISWVESLRIGDRNILAIMKEAIANANMDILRERISNFLDETILLPTEEFVAEVVKAYPETTRTAYRYVKVPISKIRFYLKRTSQVTRNMSQVAESSAADKGSFWKSLIGEVVVNDVENGEFSYQLPLSRKVHSLRDLLKLFDAESSPLKGLVITSSLRSMYHEMRAKYHPALASTRLNGYASLIGSKGIITFDKKSFDLSGGSCQYLLARDFLNMDFAVAINFEQPAGDRIKKSVIFTDGADQVEIKDEQVFVNNKLLAVTLPAKLKLKTITVQREENIVIVRRHSGAILRCDVVKDACTFELSPFYAGRTMGLWGTFSNEHADDMSEPNGKISKDMISFVNSWKINKSCKDNVQTVTDSRHVMLQSIASSGVDSYVCDKLFDDKDSDLSSCFKIVSPAPYHDLCLMSALKAKKSEPAFQRHLESLIAGYRATCQRWDVSL